MSDRTPAERRVDELSRELRDLRLIRKPTVEQRKRKLLVAEKLLPSAWAAVLRVRDR